jgi:hypothetical protein
MITIFTSSNLDHVRQALGVLESDIKTAIATATRKAFRWAERQAAREIAKETGIPYRAARVRTKSRYRLAGSGQVWFGLNPVSAKYLGAKDRKGGWTAPKLNGHIFKRRGTARLPIDRIEKPIESEGFAYAEGEFPEEVQEKLVNEFFLALDRRTGREAGASREIAMS